MGMNKQIKLYSINLGMVKTEDEKELYSMKYINDGSMFRIKQNLSNRIKKKLNTTEWTSDCNSIFKKELKENKLYRIISQENKKITKMIHKKIKDFEDIRFVDSKYFKDTNVIAFFDNVLTRTLKLESGEPTLDFIVIEVGNTDMLIVKQVIENGLTIRSRELKNDKVIVLDNKYKFFTAGAGQTRQKKFMMIKEDVWNEYEETLMCGLSIEKVNKVGGMNINKFNAYLSLNNSASEVVKNFDIDKCIVVDDFTKIINDTVDYITRDDEVDNGITEYTTKGGKKVKRKNKKTEWSIKREKKDIPFDFMDGAGICLTSVFSKNTQIRLPWFKGLLCPVNYKKYIEEHEDCSTKVKDIYGKEYDIIEDDIQIIFTKSQFKMWKFYKDWDEYKTYFKKYECTCNKCMEDEDKLKNMRINYQMLQTLTEMSDEEIENLTRETKQLVDDVHSSKDKQLEFLGATLETKHRDYMQEIIRLYPEILTSKYIKKQLSDSITSFKQEAMSGRIKLHAKRTFIIPDLVHFMSVLFGDGQDYALEKNEVFFDTYKDSKRLALLRSPHLSREWCLRNNTSNEKTKYFKTNGIYVSAKDLAYLVLMFDVDGDEALVVDSNEEQEWLINLAERQMADLVPLYYEMGGGEGKTINPTNIFNSLKFVYEKSNIGKVSNTLTNIFSKDDPDENMDNIKKLCAYNNWIIDSAKKLELPKLPKDIRQLMNNNLYPFFFQYAKGKKRSECRDIGNGVIDRICKSINSIKNSDFDYSKGFGRFMLSKLLHNKKIEINYEVVEFYLKLEEKTRKLINQYATKYKEEDADFNYKELAYTQAREDMLKYSKGIDIDYLDLVDIIIKYAFKEDEMKLAFIFNVFGAVIINNINKNLDLSLDDETVNMCECCGKRFKLKTSNSNKKYCDKCGKEINKQNALKRYHKNK